jgi:hypothetical protein
VTVRHLLAALTATRVRLEVDGPHLNWQAEGDDPPPDLLAALAVLHTGLRAVITGRRWFGIDPRTGRPCGPRPKEGRGLLAFGALDPSQKLPPAAGLLSVEGDAVWDRVHPLARLDMPHLFASEPDRGPAR